MSGIEEFTCSMQELETRIKKEIDPDGELGLILDGCVDEQAYYQATTKVLWLLKEPYDDDGGGWHLMKDFIGPRGTKAKFGKARNTWHPIVYCSYAIHQREEWETMDWIRDHPEMCEVLTDIAVINVKKTPGGKRTPSYEPLLDGYKQYGHLLREQIELLRPDIIIGGNTLFIVKDYFGLSIDKKQGHRNCPYYVDQNKKLWIDAYHPGQSTLTRKEYCELILEAVKHWRQHFVQ